MYNLPFTPEKMQTFEDINATIDLLYITQCRATKNALLNRLRRQMAQLTAVPYSIFNGNIIPVDQASELLTPVYMQGPGMQEMTQGMQQGVPQLPQGMQQGPQGMPQEPPQLPQGMQQEAQPPLGIREDIPPYIPKSMQQGMQMPPSGGTQQGMQAPPSGGTQQGMQAPSTGGTQQRAPAPSGTGQQGGGGTQGAPQQPRPRPEDLKAFTVDELSRYNGKGNNPAYVAVNGIVYDVTDQPGWAAGSHFGLKAGLDQTGSYISCHTGQPMIDRLKAVGRLVK